MGRRSDKWKVGHHGWSGNGCVAERIGGRDLRSERGHTPTDGHERVPLPPELGDDLRKCGHCLGPVASGVVQVDHGAREGGTDHPAHDRLRAGQCPVLGVDGVAHGGQAALRDLVQHSRIPRVVGRTHALWRRARHGLDLGLGHVDLRGHSGRLQRRQVRMTPGVALHRIAGGRNHFGELGIAGHLVADLEEAGGHAILLENRQHGRGVRTRTVVKGEGDHFLSGRCCTARGLRGVKGGLGTRRGRSTGGAGRQAHQRQSRQEYGADQYAPESSCPPAPSPRHHRTFALQPATAGPPPSGMRGSAAHEKPSVRRARRLGEPGGTPGIGIPVGENHPKNDHDPPVRVGIERRAGPAHNVDAEIDLLATVNGRWSNAECRMPNPTDAQGRGQRSNVIVGLDPNRPTPARTSTPWCRYSGGASP